MKKKTLLVTGSCGLIGSEVSLFFAERDFRVVGIDSNHRAVFFGPDGDTSWVLDQFPPDLEAALARPRRSTITAQHR